MLSFNYHTHTTFCDGKNTPMEMAESAAGRGLSYLGFSGHSYSPLDPQGTLDPDSSAYRRSVEEVRQRFAGTMSVFCGVEQDLYSPGGRMGLRPDRPTIVYANRAREAFPDTPIVIGGLEASLRRFAHYDYWDDKVRRALIFDAQADLLIYGMGEHQMTEIAARMAGGEHPAAMRDIRGTCYLCPLSDPLPENAVSCASFDKVSQDKKTYARACRLQLEEQDHVTGRAVVQKHGER